jgi:hypothetical protein
MLIFIAILLSFSLTDGDAPAIYVVGPADFEVLPKVIHGFAEKARTCGLPYPSLGGIALSIVTY